MRSTMVGGSFSYCAMCHLVSTDRVWRQQSIALQKVKLFCRSCTNFIEDIVLTMRRPLLVDCPDPSDSQPYRGGGTCAGRYGAGPCSWALRGRRMGRCPQRQNGHLERFLQGRDNDCKVENSNNDLGCNLSQYLVVVV